MTRLCSWLARAVASVRGASVVTGVRDTIFQATGGLTSQALRAASISAMGPRGNPFHNPGGGLSIGLNLMVGVPFAVYAGYRTGLILANAAPPAWRGPFARTGNAHPGVAPVPGVPHLPPVVERFWARALAGAVHPPEPGRSRSGRDPQAPPAAHQCVRSQGLGLLRRDRRVRIRAKALRAQQPALTIIFISGYHDDSVTVGEDGDAYLAKPVSLRNMLQTTRRCLDARTPAANQ